MLLARVRTASGQDGYSLLELLVTLGVVGIVSGSAVLSLRGLIATSRGDTAATQVASFFRYGRDAAVAQRRALELQFTQPNGLRLVRTDGGAATVVVAATRLENGARFEIAAGLPDTPDGFGRATAIDFDASDTIRFMPDGTVSDAAGVPLSGTVFITTPDAVPGVRAVTLTGTTARAQAYRWTGARWEAM
jgi:prepilin-type N-terminal cleavage/methylation domain-containing protein